MENEPSNIPPISASQETILKSTAVAEIIVALNKKKQLTMIGIGGIIFTGIGMNLDILIGGAAIMIGGGYLFWEFKKDENEIMRLKTKYGL